jgi:hypothetical protein
MYVCLLDERIQSSLDPSVDEKDLIMRKRVDTVHFGSQHLRVFIENSIKNLLIFFLTKKNGELESFARSGCPAF